MMHRGKQRTRLQGLSVVRTEYDYDDTKGTELNSTIQKEPNKAAVKLKLRSSKKNLLDSTFGTNIKTNGNKQKIILKPEKLSTAPNLECHGDENQISLRSQVSLEWPSNNSLNQMSTKDKSISSVETRTINNTSSGVELQNVTASTLVKTNNVCSIENRITTFTHRIETAEQQESTNTTTQAQSNKSYVPKQSFSPPPPIPKLRPINVVDPVLNATTCSSVNSTDTKILMEESNVTEGSQKLEDQEVGRLQWEINHLKRELDNQIQVNGDLKKLLVASVGNDLQYRVERLARDKADLSQEVGNFSRRFTQDYEELDKVSIQADMWRSKYMASRLMADELSKSKSRLQTSYQECQKALNEILLERQNLRKTLVETHSCLKQIREAFEPPGGRKPILQMSVNSLELANSSRTAAQNIRYRLLGGSTLLTSGGKEENIVMEPTPAELFAQQVLCPDNTGDMIDRPTGCMSIPRVDSIPRFHPMTRYENFTICGCSNCKGEVIAV